MNIRMRITAVAIAGVGALGLGVGTAGAALAGTGPGTVTAVTHAANHPDTTNVSGPATLVAPGYGPVWAFDNISVRFTVTPENGPGNYSVTINDNGTFSAFASPVTGDAMTGNGSVRGTIQYDVQSNGTPSAANLPAQEPGVSSRDQAGLDAGYTHTGDMLNQLFGPGSTTSVVGGGHYDFTYTLVNGQVYEQQG